MHVEVYLHTFLTAVKCKVKIHSRSGHEVPEAEYRYSSTVSLSSALDGVGGQCHAQTVLIPPRPSGLTRYPLYRRLVCPRASLDGCDLCL